MKLTPILNPEKNLLLLNTQYLPARYEIDNNGKKVKVEEDYLYMVYRDLDTGDKGLLQIPHPKTDIFVTKEEYRGKYATQRRYETEEHLDRYKVPYSEIPRALRKLIQNSSDTDLLEILNVTPKEAYKWRYSYYADYNICDYAMISYLLNNKSYQETGIINTNVSKAFLDIEADIYGLTNTEMDEGQGPVNAVSVVISNDKKGLKFTHPKVYTFLLRDWDRYKDQRYFEKHMDEFLDQCHREFDSKYNEPEFYIRIYDSELDLLRHLFTMLHYYTPDFCAIWNMSYDINKMMKRFELLGEDPNFYFCHSDFDRKICKYNFDNIFKNDFKNKTESFTCASYTTYIDQMLTYAGIRRAKQDYGGVSLDNIAGIELKAEKRRYSKKGVSVRNGAILEYWNFVLYSINDVLLQYGIENKTHDIDVLFDQSIYSGTRIFKTLKQTIYLYNAFSIEYFKKDIVMGNNLNEDYTTSNSDEISTDIELFNKIGDSEDGELNIDNYDNIELQGALVGDPDLNDYCGVEINGRPSNRYFKLIMDEDFAAQYPNANIGLNNCPQSQYGRIIIPEKVIEGENPDNDPKFLRARLFSEDYESGDISRLGRWFNLPSTYDMIKTFGEKFEPSINKSGIIMRKGKVLLHRKEVVSDGR